MDIIKETFDFAKKIQETEQFLKLKKAKQANDADEKLQVLVNEFNMCKLKLNQHLKEIGKNTKTENYEEENKKLSELYEKIMQNKNMIAFNKASDDVNALMNKINQILIAAVNDKNLENVDEFDFENEHDCAGNCQSCSGCF